MSDHPLADYRSDARRAVAWLSTGLAQGDNARKRRHVFAPALTRQATADAKTAMLARREERTVASAYTGRAALNPARVAGAVALAWDTWSQLPSDSARDYLTLWVMSTYLRDADGALATRASSIPLVTSHVPGCGKTRQLEILLALCMNAYGIDTEPTSPGIIATIGQEHATVLIDEGDILFGAGQRKEQVRALINASYSCKGSTLRVRGGQADRVSVFAPVALASLDSVLTQETDKLAATLSRMVAVMLSPATRPLPDLDDDDARIALTRAGLSEWGRTFARDVSRASAELPEVNGEVITGRRAQIWRPLLAIADHITAVCAANGYDDDDWSHRARAAFAEHVTAGMFEHVDQSVTDAFYGAGDDDQDDDADARVRDYLTGNAS